MKLKSVRITKVRGIADGTFRIGDVTVITGPNGSGKSTILGSVIFALTGRFPGLPEMGKGGAALMARDAGKPSFIVALTCETSSGDELLITRSWHHGKGGVSVYDRLDNSVAGKQAESKIASLFGDVTFMTDALSPEGSIWGLSREKRKAWASALCRSAGGWTRDRLIQEVGPVTDDWNPLALADPGASLDLNVARIRDAVRDAQAVVRQANSVAESISGNDLTTPSVEEHRALLRAHEDASKDVGEARALAESVRTERLVHDRDVRDRAHLEAKRNGWKATLAEPIFAPAAADEAEKREAERKWEALDEECLALDMDLGEARKNLQKAESALATQEWVLSRLSVTSPTTSCPTCGCIGDFSSLLDRTRVVVGDLRSHRDAFAASVNALARQQQSIAAQEAQARMVIAELAHRRSTQQAAVESSERNRAATIKKLEDAERRLTEWPEIVEPPSADEAEKRLQMAEQRVTVARSKLETARSAVALAGERAAQRSAADAASLRVDALKVLLVKVETARDKMLRESIDPLRAALRSLSSMAPAGCAWDVESDVGGAALDVGVRTPDGRLIPAETLSSGERYRLTAALLIARSKLRRDPWVGIVFDGFEQVSPSETRYATMSSIAALVRDGTIDNAIFAAATMGRAVLTDVTSIHLPVEEAIQDEPA